MQERNGINRNTRVTLPAKDLVSSVELVYRNTRMAIMTGNYPPGASLRLQELAAQNGVSMIPVREALRLLEAEGFVDIIPNRGARVAPLSVEDFRDVHQTRIVLECEALRQAIPHMTEQDISTARRLNARIVDQMQQLGYASYEDHRAFHFTLYEPSSSRWMMRLIGIIWDHTERYRRQGARLVSPMLAGDEHERIVAAAERRDAEGAVQALQHHLGQTLDTVQATLLASLEVPDVSDPVPPV
jgi:GntR family transcriptional regulator, carbon starvation induced regulator